MASPDVGGFPFIPAVTGHYQIGDTLVQPQNQSGGEEE